MRESAVALGPQNEILVNAYRERIVPGLDGYEGFHVFVDPRPVDGMYESTGLWVKTNIDNENTSGEIVVSGRAMSQLDKYELDGLLCHHTCALIYLWDLRNKGINLSEIIMVHPSAVEVDYDQIHAENFGPENIPAFRSKTANHDVKHNNVFSPSAFVEFYRAYLHKLRAVDNDLASEIIKRLEFRDQLNLNREPLHLDSADITFCADLL